MKEILLARGAGFVNILQRAFAGETSSIVALAGAVLFVVALIWFVRWMIKSQGQAIAAELAPCEYHFAPDGFFSKRHYEIIGELDGLAYYIEARRIAKGVSRIYLYVPKPSSLAWSDIRSQLERSDVWIGSAMSVSEEDDQVILEFYGYGGHAESFRVFLQDYAAIVGAHQDDG